MLRWPLSRVVADTAAMGADAPMGAADGHIEKVEVGGLRLQAVSAMPSYVEAVKLLLDRAG